MPSPRSRAAKANTPVDETNPATDETTQPEVDLEPGADETATQPTPPEPEAPKAPAKKRYLVELPHQPSVQVEAYDEHHAQALYREYCGIISTDHQFRVHELDAQGNIKKPAPAEDALEEELDLTAVTPI
jgi:hypothetical protein